MQLKKANVKKVVDICRRLFVVGEDGFEPSKRNAADLQSVPFGHSGTPPDIQLARNGAGRRTRLIKERLGLALAGNARPRCIFDLRVCFGLESEWSR